MAEEKNKLEITRVYDAPPELVWEAWIEPEMIKKWWGPNNVTAPEAEVDPRVGGKIYIVMEAGEGMGQYKGTRWPMLGEFTAVEPNSKIAYKAQAWTEGQKEETTIDQTTEVTLAKEDGKTKLKIKAVILKAAPGAEAAIQGMQYGFNQQLEKLDDFLKRSPR